MENKRIWRVLDPFIHPSPNAYPLWGWLQTWSLSQLPFGRETGVHPWRSGQLVTGPTSADKQASTLTITPNLKGNLEGTSPIPQTPAYGLWEEAGEAGEKPDRHWDPVSTKNHLELVQCWCYRAGA